MTTGTLLFGFDAPPRGHKDGVSYTVLAELPRKVTPPKGGCEGKYPKCPFLVLCRGLAGTLPCEYTLVVRYDSGERGEL